MPVLPIPGRLTVGFVGIGNMGWPMAAELYAGAADSALTR